MKSHRKNNCFLPVAGRFILLFSIGAFNLSSQADYTSYKFIKKDKNHLSFSNDSSSFLSFCGKLDWLKTGSLQKITVVHIGGSHVQGGIWSNVFVNSFQKQFNTSGGGYFVFPYKIAKTNGQPYARSFTTGNWKRCRALGKDYCQPLGMCAMNVSTNDSANTFGACLTQYAGCNKANVVRVYHNFNSSFTFSVKGGIALNTQSGGDQALGYTQFYFSQALDSVVFELKKLDTIHKDFIIYGLSFENNQNPGFYLAGLGANGASSSSFLRCGYFVPQLASIQPDLVILSLGVNDTQSKGFEKEDYIEHYDSLITNIRRASPGALIVLTTTTDNYIKRRTSNKRSISAHDAMFELMQKHQVVVWDLFTIMGGYKSMTLWNKAGLAARDKVHFTARGYTLLGNMMFEAFLKSYKNNSKSG